MRHLWQTSAAKASAVFLALASCQAIHEIDTAAHETSPATAATTTVEAASLAMHMSDAGWLLVQGTNLNGIRLHFDPPLPESKFHRQLLSPNYLAVFKIHGAAGPIPWRAEPGPIKVVAIEDGDDYFKLDGGGVVVAEILADDHNAGVAPPLPPRASNKPPPPRLMEPEHVAVSVLSSHTIDDFIKADFAVVTFYSANADSPEYTKASVELKRLAPVIMLGKVDMADDTNRSLVERFGIREFPAMKIFRHGVEVSYLSAALDATQIVDYLFTAKTKEDRVWAPPATHLLRGPLPLVEPEESEVSVLSQHNIDDFIRAGFAAVEFYAPKCPHCVTLFPEYTKASIELKRVDPDIRVGKVDMTDDVNRPLFERFGVRRYPIIKFFHNGVELSSLGVVRDAAKIVEYLTSEKAKELMAMSTEASNTPSIDASDVEVFCDRTQELLITGNGFSETDPPELLFEHALDRGVKTDFVNRSTIRVDLRAASSGWIMMDGHIGPLKIEGIVTAAGMKVVTPAVTVATAMPNFGASESDAQVHY